MGDTLGHLVTSLPHFPIFNMTFLYRGDYMTIDQAIKLTDTLQPNPYPRDMKLHWLGKLDGRIFQEVLACHADCPIAVFHGYEGMAGDTELLVPFPYDEDLYISFLQAQIDRENGEAARYNRAVTLYNSAFRAFADHYHRNHMPLGHGGFRL